MPGRRSGHAPLLTQNEAPLDHTALNSILAFSFRANPKYELILFDRLPDREKELLRDLQKDADLYGILRPCESSGLGLKSVDRDTALLFLTLRQPGTLPDYVLRTHGAGANDAIAQLVLDGLLEMDAGEGFRSGAAASAVICSAEQPPDGDGVTARLSLDALRYAQALHIDDIQQLSARLYFYNRVPLTPRWKKALPSREAVLRYLGIEEGGVNRRLLGENWSEAQVPLPYSTGWMQWQSRHPYTPVAHGRYGHKLYISAACESLPEALPAIVDVLSQSSASHFKIGSDAAGLLRPDKIVAYFATLDGVEHAAGLLAGRLRGCPAQGVPFTAQISEDGLLSRGADPPTGDPTVGWLQRESWRLWITNRLATALLAAKAAAPAVVEPWRFALQRIRLEGVDTEHWSPSDHMWPTDEHKE